MKSSPSLSGRRLAAGGGRRLVLPVVLSATFVQLLNVTVAQIAAPAAVSPTTLPVGFGGTEPVVSETILEAGDLILCFTDGLVKEHRSGERQFGEDRLIDWVDRLAGTRMQPRAMVRALSHALKDSREGHITGDATLFLIEWPGPAAPGPTTP
ncbi:SpoIIE family protein phosphatase [Streptomyces flaveolus]|uniref:SpoIIE family protein phosphatase n=1 Tax=Streptomyces flaveolus TaxID=67297 RepID=UPI0037010AC4